MPLRQLVDVAAILAEIEGDPAMRSDEKLVALIQAAPRAEILGKPLGL
jgi:hypothetical protein